MDEQKKWLLTILKSARKLEKEGYDFYTKAAEKTGDKNGRDMFRFLALEEVKHYKVVDDLLVQSGGEHKPVEEEDAGKSDVFAETQGGRVGEKAYDLDALNIGIRAEKKSIETYSKLHDQVKTRKIKKTAKKLADEEKKHLSILEAQVEFITNTGEYRDFKTITM